MTEATQAPVPGSPEWDAAMIAAAEQGGVRIRMSDETSGQSVEVAAGDLKTDAPENKTADIKQRPDHIPEKFWNKDKGEVDVDGMAKSYAELERNRAQPTQTQQPTQKEPAPEVKAAADAATKATAAKTAFDAADAKAKAEGATDADKAAVATAQVALTAANEAATAAKAAADAAAARPPAIDEVLKTADSEFTKDGKLSDATYEALSKNGISKEYADAYMTGLQAQAELAASKVYGEAGGQEQYGKMIAWAQANMSAEQIEAFNTAVTSGKLEATLGAVKNLKSLYTEAQGTDPATRVEPKGGSNAATTGDMFRSKDEATKAMSNPLYQKGDKAYHAEVDRKLSASMAAGIDLGF